MNYAELAVGQEVAVSRTGNWRIHNEGVYKVVKANKLKVVLERVNDGHTREFSVKRRVEVGKFIESRWASPFIETVEEMQRRQAVYQAERDQRQAWLDAEQAARDKNLTKLKDIVAKLSQMAV